MDFALHWDDDAIDQLARVWLAAPDPRLVTAAVNSMERELVRQPWHYGQELSEGLRVWQFGPVRVFYSIDEVKKSVIVSWIVLAP